MLHHFHAPRSSRRRLLAVAAAVGMTIRVPLLAAEPFVNYAKRDAVRYWAAQVSEKRDIPFAWIIQALSRARMSDSTIKIMSRPALTASTTPKNWLRHRQRFITTARVADGCRFLEDHAPAFQACEERFHVPSAVVASVIGIETNYGRLMGTTKTLDALCTLSFDYTRRAAFFQNELESFLALSWKAKTDPLTVRGSFAGALGICQFMPSSIERLGIDLDEDGVVNLMTSVEDAVASAANYLHSVGWDDALPISWACRVPSAVVPFFATGEPVLTTTLQNLLDAGIELKAPLAVPPSLKVLLADFPLEKQRHYRVGTVNFAALLDYNRSFFYAQSVADLAACITTRRVLPPDLL